MIQHQGKTANSYLRKRVEISPELSNEIADILSFQDFLGDSGI
jgi:hypothetical protein